MTSIEVLGLYPVAATEPCHLVELEVGSCPGRFDVGAITQADADLPPSDWQAPYAEKLLTPEGDAILWDLWDGRGDDEMWRGTVRLAFFMHHLHLGRPLLTPFGEVALPAPAPRPQRLQSIEYAEP